MRTIGRLACASLTVLAIAVASPAVGAAAAKGCNATGKVLAHKGAVTVWSVLGDNGRRDRLYVCEPAYGTHVAEAESGNAAFHVSRLKVAGQFVAFALEETEELQMTNLLVVNAHNGRDELFDEISCEGNDECAGVPPLSSYVLAKNGWVAEVWQNTDDDLGRDVLVATDNSKHHYQLDLARSITKLSVSGGVLHWNTDVGGAASVRLGPDVVPPAAPLAIGCGQLLPVAEVDLVLGPGSVASPAPAGTCTRTSQSNPDMKLSFSFQTGLTQSQSVSDQEALDQDFWDNASWPDDDDFQIYENSAVVAGGGGTTESLAEFVNGVAVTIQLTAAGSNAEEQLGYLGTLALQNAFGISVARSS
jgi:hypothetical protein